MSISPMMKALVLLLVGTLLPLTATTIFFDTSAGLFTSVPGATTITFDGLAASPPSSPYSSGIATYAWSAANPPFVVGTTGQYASPPGDTTDYLTLGSPGRPGSVTIDFSRPIDYFGFYMGSPDSYNSIDFYEGQGSSRSLILHMRGDELIAPGGGNQSLGAYLNFHASGGAIGEIVMSSTSPAFETDNHSYEAVPEPGTWVLFCVGLGLVVAARAKSKRS